MTRFIPMILALLVVSCAPDAKLLDSPLVKELDTGKSAGKARFDHRVFDAFLQAVVDSETHWVDYAAAKTRAGDLDEYLASVAGAKLGELPPNEQKALLINAYNAFTIKLILNNLPLNSIREIDAPWKTKRYKIGGYTVSLNDIEHGLLRPYFRDERIHFAVNCASIGCPPLYEHAFQGKYLDKQLDDAARRTLQDTRHVRIQDGKLLLTSIMNWYGEDFTNPKFRGTAPTIPVYVARFANDDVKALVKKSGGDPETAWIEYDWRLNAKH